MPASKKQVRANRKNAKKATGPKTPDGKAKSCLRAARQAKAQAGRKAHNSKEFDERTHFHVNIPTAKTNSIFGDLTRPDDDDMTVEPNSMHGEQ